MAALHEADIVDIVFTECRRQHLVHPGAGGIHQHARPVGLGFSGDIFRFNPPEGAFAPGRNHLRAIEDQSTAISGIAGIQHHKTGIVHPAIRIFKGAGENRLQRLSGGITAQIKRACGGQKLAAAEMVVKK
ncbi:hypothetical protein D3C78_1131580 [compost metagenome]